MAKMSHEYSTLINRIDDQDRSTLALERVQEEIKAQDDKTEKLKDHLDELRAKIIVDSETIGKRLLEKDELIQLVVKDLEYLKSQA